MIGRGAALLAALLAATPAWAQRVELPVRLVELSDGTRRFGVPVTIDGKAVEAGLDTGSTGLRVMARAMPDAPRGGAAAHYSYGSGTQLDGPVVAATVGFGTLSGSVRVQRVDALSCTPARRNCPVKRNGDVQTFGIQGDGLPGEGFAAILGVNLRPAGAPNPWTTLGVRRWIVELPRPGDVAGGRIVLNPTDAEVAGYQAVRFLGDDNQVAACLDGAPPVGRVCAPATIDSGAPGIFLLGAGPRSAPTGEVPFTLTIGDPHRAVTAALNGNRRDQATRLAVAPAADGHPSIHLGVAPYWVWSILYDSDAHTVGFKRR